MSRVTLPCETSSFTRRQEGGAAPVCTDCLVSYERMPPTSVGGRGKVGSGDPRSSLNREPYFGEKVGTSAVDASEVRERCPMKETVDPPLPSPKTNGEHRGQTEGADQKTGKVVFTF